MSTKAAIEVAQRIVDMHANDHPKVQGKRVTKVEQSGPLEVKLWLDGKPAGEMMGLFAAKIIAALDAEEDIEVN